MNWTSHALIDVGMAALCAMAGRTRPGDLTEDDLASVTDELSDVYFSGVMISYLTCVFMNSAYVQPGMKDASKEDYKDRILKAYRQPQPPELAGISCVFCGEPAVALVHRGQIPMLTGEDTLNFYPAGRGGLPVSGGCLTAIQALPMGCKRVEGKLFAVHGDNPELTVAMARRYVEDNRRLIALSRAGKITKESGPPEGLTREVSMAEKYPDSKSPASFITADLMGVLSQLKLARTGAVSFGSVSCYWLSSSGQGPFLDLFYLPSHLIRFLVFAESADYSAAWHKAIAQAWRSASKETATAPEGPKRKRASKPSAPGGPGRSRNDLLDDLIRIYRDGNLSRDAAKAFVSRHLLRYRRGEGGQPRIERAEWNDWKLTQLLLKEVLGMTQERIDRIRAFADRLAEHIAKTRDKKLFRGVVYSSRAYELRNALTRAQRGEAHDHNTLLFGLAEYLEVFESEDMVRIGDWSLTRDLISIRLVESLHDRGFFGENADLLEESAETQAS